MGTLPKELQCISPPCLPACRAMGPATAIEFGRQVLFSDVRPKLLASWKARQGSRSNAAHAVRSAATPQPPWQKKLQPIIIKRVEGGHSVLGAPGRSLTRRLCDGIDGVLPADVAARLPHGQRG